MAAKKTWREKINNAPKDLPKTVDDPRGRGKMYVASPAVVENEIRNIQKGRLATSDSLRKKLARKNKADFTCPLSFGWFMRLVAEAAEEESAKGIKHPAPWWRVIKEDGTLNLKFPGEGRLQELLLQKEGIKVSKRGNEYLVLNFKDFID